MTYRPAQTAVLERIEALTADEVAALALSPTSAAATAGRRALALSGHGMAFADIDRALRSVRPDVSPQVRVALRWAILAEASRDTLTVTQHAALAGPFTTVHV